MLETIELVLKILIKFYLLMCYNLTCYLSQSVIAL